MMKGFKYACFSVLSLALLSACSMDQSSESSMGNQPTMNTTTNKNALVGKDASDFELKDMKGNTVKLSDYKGKKVYLKFWATWCGPCRQSMPELEKLVKDTDRDFEILTIMAPGLQGEKTEEEFVKWFDQQDYKSVPVLYNQDGSAFADYQVRSIPTEVFIDSRGKIGHVQLGAISNDDAKKIIKELQ
ncbi:redoxin domain-containing protein [Streptococcus parasanguinis]|uniref:Redoxin domain-containing protein n=2 Tax=Streptococcus TaxID=1301 RepID=A0A6L6LCW7_STRPA|nr:redoxin domain-containing protein [Streptococcus parasanguinis]MTR64129.1 redoxin domain-containing protein [Streptococcus parasanguinis]MTR68747.1 redoxin domain-containing protein [Streptococcus parasanguinis]MTS04844.1 redoxin domain-containing protein [Streptococcus parasanguinis]